MNDTTATLNSIDVDALRRCVELKLAAGSDRAEQVRDMLRDRSWREVAEFCSYSLQMDALNLKPWQSPPSWDDDQERDPQARALAARLRAAGLSIFEPSPLEALARAETRRSRR